MSSEQMYVSKMPTLKVVVSSNDRHDFLNFLPVVCAGWRRFYDLDVILAFVSDRTSKDPLLETLGSYAQVELIKPNPNAPHANQAKLARYYAASRQAKDTLITVEDIDTVPLCGGWVLDKIKQRRGGEILGVGSEVYTRPQDCGKFPASTMTGEPQLFDKLFRCSEYESFSEWVGSYKGTRLFDDYEDPFNPPEKFSDESLIRYQRAVNTSVKVFLIPRDVDVKEQWVDRSAWSIDRRKLYKESYLFANLMRPCSFHDRKHQEIYEYIFGKKIEPKELRLLGITSASKASYHICKAFTDQFIRLRILAVRLLRLGWRRPQ